MGLRRRGGGSRRGGAMDAGSEWGGRGYGEDVDEFREVDRPTIHSVRRRYGFPL